MKRELTGIVVSMLVAGCASPQQQEVQQLSQVAKGWCLAIRASQVIPVYPLQEDVEVGDMFIVQRPLEDEAYLYDNAGFLPLGQHIHRLNPAGFDDFYSGGTPVHFALPVPKSSPPRFATTQLSPASTQPTTAPTWEDLPRAAFPSYSFTAGRSAGASAEIPVKGIPVAVSALGADSASVTVTLSDAYAYGLDVDTLDSLARSWAVKHPEILYEFRAAFTPPKTFFSILGDTEYRKQYNYLRVVSRVYFIKGVDVNATNTSQSAESLSAGNAPQLTLLDPTTQPSFTQGGAAGKGQSDDEPASQSGQKGDEVASPAVAAVSSAVAGAVKAGGRLKMTAYSKGSITLSETFDRPMAIGYLAFDIPINEDGILGTRPVSTQVRLMNLGNGFSRTTVGEWAAHDPDAGANLGEWIKGPDNKALVENDSEARDKIISVIKRDSNASDVNLHNGVLTIIDTHKLATTRPLTGQDVDEFLIENAPKPFFYAIPVLGDFVLFIVPPNIVYSKVTQDVIRRPPGLPAATRPSAEP